jgi:cell division protein FtsZ
VFEGVELICANTDAQALKSARVKLGLQIGCNITKGLGAGADPEIGRQAAMEDRDRIQEVIEGADMLFITVGLGGGTGTGAAPVVASLAKELGILTVAVVTKPFGMEGEKRMRIAEQGIEELGRHVDSLITIPNEKLLSVYGSDVTLLDAFNSANQVLQGAVQGIADLITRPGLINVDFADVRTVMSDPYTLSNFSLGIVISESTCRPSSSMPCSAMRIRFSPSIPKGLVTTATVKIPSSLASDATTGAAPVPVPPPRPTVINSMSAPSITSWIRSRSSMAA